MAIDEQLIKQIKQGKSEAFGQLFRKYQKKVYSICLSIVKEPHDAEEVTQDTFVHAYLKIGQLRKPERFSSWLKRIAQNRSKNYLNSKQEKTVPLVAATEDISTQTTPDRLLLKRELIDAIIEAIESLPQEDKEMIQARIDGLSHSEISERFGISISTSTTRLYRIRKKIKARVKELLSTIIGLPNTLPLEKIISGGITAMKIGTSTKITVGVVGAIITGFIGFQAVTHNKTQQKVKPTEKITQQTVRLKSQPKTVRKNSDKSKSVIQDEQYSNEEIEEALAWLDSLQSEEPKSENNPDQEIDDEDDENEKNQQDELVWRGMTREEIDAEIAVLEQKIRTNLTKATSLYKDLRSTDGMAGRSPEIAKWRKETWAEIRQLIRETLRPVSLYVTGLKVTGRDYLAAKRWINDELLDGLNEHVSYDFD